MALPRSRLATVARQVPNVQHVEGLRLLAAQHHVHNTPAFFVQDKLREAGDVVGLAVREKWYQRDRNCLWWASVAQNLRVKSVVRSWLDRRFRVALKEVLMQAGYDGDGRALESGGQNLTGSLKMVPTKDAITANLEDIKAELRSVLSVVRQRSRKLVTLVHG